MKKDNCNFICIYLFENECGSSPYHEDCCSKDCSFGYSCYNCGNTNCKNKKVEI